MVVDAADLVEECRAFNVQMEELMASLPPIDSVPAEVTRKARSDGRGIFPAPVFLPRARELRIAGRGGEIPLRVIPPEREATGVYLHIHGGGHVLGSAAEMDTLLAELADETGLCVVSVEYRLAPEHPFPAGPDDCEDAALWLAGEGARELDVPERFAIGGESAGAHLSALTLLRLRDRHGLRPFAAANLVYGVFDLGGTPSQLLWGEERALVLSRRSMGWFTECFLPGTTRDERRAPEISPLYNDLSGMPPALFTVGTADPLLDDSLFMAARWQAAGSEAELRLYAEAAHGFNLFPLQAAQHANAAQRDFLRRVV